MVGMDLADSEPPKGVCAVGVIGTRTGGWSLSPIAYRIRKQNKLMADNR